MEENKGTNSDINTPPIPVNMAIQSEQPKSNSFIITLLSVLLFVTVLIAGFFAYQTQKLVKELQTINSEKEVVATVKPTYEPGLQPEPLPSDPTANWKTYTNTSANYEIKYPIDWKAGNVAAGSDGTLPANARYIEIGLGEGKSGTLGIEEIQMIPPSEESNLTSTKVVGSLTLKCNGKFTTDTKTWCWIKVPGQEKYLNIQLFKNSNEINNKLLDQILSTFKFIKPTAVTSPLP